MTLKRWRMLFLCRLSSLQSLTLAFQRAPGHGSGQHHLCTSRCGAKWVINAQKNAGDPSPGAFRGRDFVIRRRSCVQTCAFVRCAARGVLRRAYCGGRWVGGERGTRILVDMRGRSRRALAFGCASHGVRSAAMLPERGLYSYPCLIHAVHSESYLLPRAGARGADKAAHYV